MIRSVSNRMITPWSRSSSTPAFVVSGAVAGMFSAFIFCVVHQLIISPIWFSLLALLIAGAVCGSCLAWSYDVAVTPRSLRGWFEYNALYVAVLVALGVTSLIIFEPVTTIAALLRSKTPPIALIADAFPITVGFTVISAVLLSMRYRPGWGGIGAIALTTIVVVLFLGMNISILGLVFIPRGSFYVIAEVLVLIVILALSYVLSIVFFWRVSGQRTLPPPNTR